MQASRGSQLARWPGSPAALSGGMHRQAGEQAGSQPDRLADRQTDKQTDRQAGNRPPCQPMLENVYSKHSTANLSCRQNIHNPQATKHKRTHFPLVA